LREFLISAFSIYRCYFGAIFRKTFVAVEQTQRFVSVKRRITFGVAAIALSPIVPSASSAAIRTAAFDSPRQAASTGF